MKKWTVTLRAKGLEQIVKIPHLGTCVQTSTALASGSIVKHYYCVISVDVTKRTALAIFDRSANMVVGHRGMRVAR